MRQPLPLSVSIGSPPAVGAWGRRALLAWAVGGVLAGVSGCGFRLRGEVKLPFASVRVNLAGQTPLGQELVAQLQTSGVRVLTPQTPRTPGQPAEAVDLVLDVLTDQRERVVVGKTAAGQVRELQLRQRFKFRVRTPAGKELIPDLELLQERDLSFSETQVLGKEAEEALLYRDMQDAMVRQVMFRLAALKGL